MLIISEANKKIIRIFLLCLPIKMKNGIFISRFSKLLAKKITIHQGTRINGKIVIKGNGTAEIGSYCCFGHDIKMITSNHKTQSVALSINLQRQLGISDVHDKEKINIKISDNVWVGDSVIILPGVEIGSGSIVAAGSVVTKNIPENSIYAGIPAKFIKNRLNQELHDEIQKSELWKHTPKKIQEKINSSPTLKRAFGLEATSNNA